MDEEVRKGTRPARGSTCLLGILSSIFATFSNAIGHIEEFVKGLEFEAYRRDEKTKSAVERKIQILTEAVIRLEGEDPKVYIEIDWKAYRGLGNFLRHSYDRVEDEIVWNSIKEDFPGAQGDCRKRAAFSQFEVTRRWCQVF